MEIGVGPLSGCYDTVVCLSDFETGDLLCLRMLASRCADVPFRMVVGEGDQDKPPSGPEAVDRQALVERL